MVRWSDGQMGEIFIKRDLRGLGEAARSWGFPPRPRCRGFHGANSGADASSAHRTMRHSRFAWLTG